MASSIEDILMAKAMADAQNRPTTGGAAGMGAALGGTLGALAPVAKGASVGGNIKTRLAGSLVGLLVGGGLGAGTRQLAIQESPAANMLAKIQSQGGQLSQYDAAQLQSILRDLYNNPGM